MTSKQKIISQLSAKVEAVCRKRKAIPGEPCGRARYGSPRDCQNPRHAEYFHLTTELERLRGLLARARRLS